MCYFYTLITKKLEIINSVWSFDCNLRHITSLFQSSCDGAGGAINIVNNTSPEVKPHEESYGVGMGGIVLVNPNQDKWTLKHTPEGYWALSHQSMSSILLYTYKKM